MKTIDILGAPPHFIDNRNDAKKCDVADHVRQILLDYLKERPNLSVNGISKKCGVSEPTLRRIISGRVKTTPQVTTVLDVLTYVSGTTSLREIVKKYPGPVALFLNEAMPYLEEMDRDYSNALSEELKNPVKYLIYKLALNHNGVAQQKVVELYGNHGLQLLEEMITSGFIKRNEQNRCFTKIKSFSSNHADFVRNFKAVAEFIKPEKHRNRKPLNPFFVNASQSLNAEAYEQILRLQKSTQKKIRKILSDPNSQGPIPSFFLCAIDSLDFKSPYEIDEEKG